VNLGIRNWPWPASLPAVDEIRLSPLARWVLEVDGSLALIQGLVMFVAPGRILLAVASAALSCRVIGAVFCMGGAGPPGFTDPRWSTVKLVEHGQAVVASRNDHGDSHPRCGVPRRARIRSRQEADPAARRRVARDPRQLGLSFGCNDQAREGAQPRTSRLRRRTPGCSKRKVIG
jgi:hypothetical protein